MACSEGACVVEGGIAYCQQDPWIQCMTLRDNILFGSPYDEDDVSNITAPNAAYQQAVDGAALQRDIDLLPDGDLTEIGERGVNVSGGQRARISLARAILAAPRSQVYLLDDPFAAVDGATGEHMFSRGVQAALRGKLRILVMNSHMELLRHFDRVVMLQGGRVLACAPPAALLDSPATRKAFLSMTGLAVGDPGPAPEEPPAGSAPAADSVCILEALISLVNLICILTNI
jgi:ATP-binding cassette subfamily C (CFTR/MRP) protein 1